MKTISIALLKTAVVFVVILCAEGCDGSKRELDRLAILKNEVTINNLNQEIGIAFNRFGTNATRSLEASDLKDFPTINKFEGNSVVLFAASPGLPAHIRLRYGSHFQTGLIFIFAPGDSASLKSLPYVPASSNIFFVK